MSTPSFTKFGLWILGLWTILALAGCTTCHETFSGHDADHVWTAMVAVAQTPNYNDPAYNRRWVVRENNVWVDDQEHRIEIQRRLERTLYRAGSKPLHEQRDWKFQVTMTHNDPPEAKFTSRELGVPSHTWDEAERYFAEVWDVLHGAAPAKAVAMPVPPPRSTAQAPAAPPPPTTEPKADQPIIDIESLEPQKP